jgi:hypothetical protein
MGEPGFPIPLRKGQALPNAPAGGGMGELAFPIPLRKGQALPNAPAGGGYGGTWFPHVHVRRRPASQDRSPRLMVFEEFNPVSRASRRAKALG